MFKHTRFLCVTSGKGGVGKTTLCVNLAQGLRERGVDVILADSNLSTPHVHIHLGECFFDRDLHHSIRGEIHPSEVVQEHDGLRVVPLISTLEHLKMPDYEGLRDALMDLDGFADLVIIDSAPGFSEESIIPLQVADEVLVVTAPDPASLAEARKCLDVARDLGKHVVGVVVNMKGKTPYEEEVKDIEERLGVPVISVIPHDEKVVLSLKLKKPVVKTHPKSKASKEFYRLASLLIGSRYSESLKREEEEGAAAVLLKKLGLK